MDFYKGFNKGKVDAVHLVAQCLLSPQIVLQRTLTLLYHDVII